MLVCIIGACLVTAFAQDSTSAESSQKIFQWRPFLAPFHAVVLHFPIGFLTVAFVLEVYRIFRPSNELRPVTSLIIWLSLLSGILSATFGWMRAATGAYDLEAVELHRNFGIAVPAFTLATLALQKFAYRNEVFRIRTYAYRGLLACTLGLLVVAGHLGGSLTHGSEYLVKNAPEFIRKLLQDAAKEDTQSELAALDQKQRFFTEQVKPIFEEKCYSCHGSEKQKSRYRLDIPETALKGGSSGETAIKPGDPIGSFLIQLILLHPQHDDVMPPEGKQNLSIEEIMTILDWVRNGAVFSDSDDSTRIQPVDE